MRGSYHQHSNQEDHIIIVRISYRLLTCSALCERVIWVILNLLHLLNSTAERSPAKPGDTDKAEMCCRYCIWLNQMFVFCFRWLEIPVLVGLNWLWVVSMLGGKQKRRQKLIIIIMTCTCARLGGYLQVRGQKICLFLSIQCPLNLTYSMHVFCSIFCFSHKLDSTHSREWIFNSSFKSKIIIIVSRSDNNE